MASWRIPLVDLRAQHRTIAGELEPAVRAVIEEQRFILGEPVARFERTLARLSQVRYAIGVASGTDALYLALTVAGVGPGDAVITSAFGFVATPEAILRTGAHPIFVDIDGFNLSAAEVKASVAEHASGAALAAILPVHLFGECAPMREISALARQQRLQLIEDAAQAIGATSDGRPAGSFGDAAALSFFPSKNLGAWGDGGAVLTSRKDIDEGVRSLRVHGGTERLLLGTNSRLDALQAAVLDVKAAHLEAWVVARNTAATRYRQLLAALGDAVRLPPLPREGDRHAYNQFVVRVERRDRLRDHLAEAGIESRAYYPEPLHLLPAFAEEARRQPPLRNAEEAARTALGIPIYPEITLAQQEDVVDVIRRFIS